MKKTPLLLFTLAIILCVSLSSSSLKISTGNSEYVGPEQCGSCHTDAYEGWIQTNHANAVMLIQNASGNFYSIGSTSNLEETLSRVYNETSFMASCRDCHVTGGNNFDPLGEANQTWPEQDTDPAKFLNIQCEVCHGAGMEQPWGEASMIVNYSATLCELCHTPESTHDNSHWQSAHAKSIADLLTSDHASDSCLSCMSTQGALGLDVSLNTTNLESISCVACHDPHSHTYEAQLRYEDSTELCGQCHSGSRHPQYAVFMEGPHEKAGLECTSCHGNGTIFAHGHISAIVNHTWAVSGIYYPYNQTMAEEPIVCSTCHSQDWATSQLEVIQDLTTELITNVTQVIDNAKATITIANQTSGVDQTKIEEALAKIETAESYVHYVEDDSSEGFHNPEGTFATLSEAALLASEAESTALEARAITLASNVTSLGTQVSNLQNQVTSLQSDIEDLEAKIGKPTTAIYTYLGIGLVVGFIIGAAIIFALRRGKP